VRPLAASVNAAGGLAAFTAPKVDFSPAIAALTTAPFLKPSVSTSFADPALGSSILAAAAALGSRNAELLGQVYASGLAASIAKLNARNAELLGQGLIASLDSLKADFARIVSAQAEQALAAWRPPRGWPSSRRLRACKPPTTPHTTAWSPQRRG
jgi:hypothetical protein